MEQPHLIPIDARNYELAHDYKIDGKVIKAGTVSDLASIPFWLWGLFGLRPDGLYRRASFGHDIRIRKLKKLYAGKIPKKLKKPIDKIFLKEMLEDGVKPWKAKLMYRSVRLFGRWY